MEKYGFLLMLVIGAMACSCGNEVVLRQTAEERQGFAVIIEKAYVPGTRGRGTALGTGINAMGGHFSTSGSSGFGSISQVSVSSHQQFILVFQSEWDGIFTLEDKNLYSQYEKGDTVAFKYTVILDKIKNRETNMIRFEKYRIKSGRIINEQEYYTE